MGETGNVKSEFLKFPFSHWGKAEFLKFLFHIGGNRKCETGIFKFKVSHWGKSELGETGDNHFFYIAHFFISPLMLGLLSSYLFHNSLLH